MKKKLLFSLLIFCSSINVALCDDDFFTKFQKTCEWDVDGYVGDYVSDDQECMIDITSPKTIRFDKLKTQNDNIVSNFAAYGTTCDEIYYATDKIWLAKCKNEDGSNIANIVLNYGGIEITCDEGYEFNEARGECSQKDPEYEKPPVEEPEQAPEPVKSQQETESKLLFERTTNVRDYDAYKPKDLDDAIQTIKDSAKYDVDTDKCLTDTFSANPPSISCPGTGKDEGEIYVFHFQSSESDEVAEPIDEEEDLDEKEGKPQIEHIYDFEDKEFADGGEALDFIQTSKYKDKIITCPVYDFNEEYIDCTATPAANAESYRFHFKSIRSEEADAVEQAPAEEEEPVESLLTKDEEKKLKQDLERLVAAVDKGKAYLKEQKKQ